MQFAGKVVLVTGAQQGIDRAMALEFAAAGADVAINWLDDDGAAQGAADEIHACGRRAILVQADVGQIEQVRRRQLEGARAFVRSSSRGDGLGWAARETIINIEATGSHVPYKSLIRLRAAYVPDWKP